MDVIALLLLASMVLWKNIPESHAIHCYRCLPDRPNNNDPTPLCQDFDGSAKFVKNCPDSTGCIKKTTQLLSLQGNTLSEERDCAFQTMAGYQERDETGWHFVKKIHEVYKEGCEDEPNEFDKPTKTTHCFCRNDRCNSGEKLGRSALAVATAAILWAVLT